MCGVFGFIGTGGRIDMRTLTAAAMAAEARGRHAWGMAWIDRGGRMHCYKQPGPVSDSLGLLKWAGDAVALIGHTRWATHGKPEDNANNHPHPSDGGWIVHNGVIQNHGALIGDHGLLPVTACDSEVLALLIEAGTGPLLDRCRDAIDLTERSSGLVMLGLWKPGRVIVARRGNPLSYATRPEGAYLCSLSAGLPGGAVDVPDGSVSAFTPGKDDLKRRRLALATGEESALLEWVDTPAGRMPTEPEGEPEGMASWVRPDTAQPEPAACPLGKARRR